ncbi:hypothetical protein QQZ08_011765 [Neonectria magnoliae]|uniref:Alcohol dehydrogenase-like C-terminal domain-containing protein n=1 Tax=Neonectria magnoliae TaxID=2732573 RepID=A0ABR1H951_9HYPO
MNSNTDLALFAPLGCGLQTGAGAILNTLNVKAAKIVAIFGVGSVGMSAVMAAKMRGAREIIAIDLQQSRLDLATKLGATKTILGNDPEVVAKIQQISPPNGIHYAVDCSGVPAVIQNMVDSLGSRGKAATVGAPALIPFLMKEHAKGNYPIENLITVYDMKDFNQAVKDAKSGKTLKAVLRWS